MRVLLLQEMSGVHTELKKGLSMLGIHCDIATVGQQYRKYQSDINIGNDKNDIINSLKRAYKQLTNIPNFNSYDVIQTISPNPFHKGVSKIIENLIYTKDKKIIYVAAGSDLIYRKHVQEFKYWPIHNNYGNNHDYKVFKKKISKFNHIVPVCWDYKTTMNKAGLSTENIIPLPIDVQHQKYTPYNQDKVIKIFHPLNRLNWEKQDFKGTYYILKAFEELEKKYKGKVEFIAKGGMSSKEYDKFTDNVDIIVEQTNFYTYGMSAAYGLAKGKVILSGLEDVAKEKHYQHAPIINIQPNVSMIVNELEKLIKNRDLISTLSEKSRLFAEKYHDTRNVALEFNKIYNK